MRKIETSEAIEHGMAWLDKEHPGWELQIDLGELNMAHSCSCILGQLEQDFLRACTMRDKGLRWAWWRGFYLFPVKGIPHRYDELTEAWRAAIKQRLDAGITL